METAECMFCLENVAKRYELRPCECLLQYHHECYIKWVEMYGAKCPLCRKTPIPIVNHLTLELEFEFATNSPLYPTEIVVTPVSENERTQVKNMCLLCASLFASITVLTLLILRLLYII